jgi:hypothetical protein
MKSFWKQMQVILVLVVLVVLSGCTLGQTTAATATPIDVNAVMTSAAATAFVQLTQIAGQSSPTSAPTQTPTVASSTKTPDALASATTQSPGLQLLTPTSTGGAAGGLPAVATSAIGGGLPTSTSALSLTLVVPVASTSNVPICYNSKFIADISIPDGTVLKPYEKFRKIWRIQNTGTCSWDQGFGLTIWNGPSMYGYPIYFSSNDLPVAPGGIVDLGIDMRAPTQPGDYVAHWTMISDQGKAFGGDLTVVIKVSN